MSRKSDEAEWDRLRPLLSDQDDGRPPEIRDQLLKLHQLAMAVIKKGDRGQATEMFDLVGEIASQADEIVEVIERLRRIVTDLSDLYPENLGYAELEEWDRRRPK